MGREARCAVPAACAGALGDAHPFGAAKEEQAVARSAWESGALEFFRWFAEKPAYAGTTSGSTCVWFVDLRFDTPGRPLTPFRYGACRDAPSAPWRLVIS